VKHVTEIVAHKWFGERRCGAGASTLLLEDGRVPTFTCPVRNKIVGPKYYK
jgi:hypothetical protein